MSPRRVDVARKEFALPDPGIGEGWEASALLGLTLVLLSFGLVTLFSASPFAASRIGVPDHHFVVRQASGAAVGLLGMLALARLRYRIWEWLAWPLVGASFVSLVILILPGTEGIAPELNGARRWLRVGVTIQPSEFAKLAIIIWTAMLAVKKRDQFRSLSRGLVPFLIVWGFLLLPIAAQPDLSTAFLAGMLGVLTAFAAGARVSHFIFLGILTSPLAWMLLQVDFRRARMESYLAQLADPLAAPSSGAGYQFYQAMVALGSGGITGQGFGKGMQKFGFLPEPHNDFIFSMLGEEWGFLGVCVLVALFMALVLVGYRVSRRAPDTFGQLLALGCTNLIALQGLLHIGVGVGLLPTTGLALPLFSYGRSNLLVTLAALGILMSVARETDRDRAPSVRRETRTGDLMRRVATAGGGGRA
jgi:cell division protein FtsW